MALATKTNVFEIHTKTLVKDRMHEKLLKWLFPLNSSWRPECQKKRVDGTNLKYLDRSSETATCRTLSTMEIQAQGNDSLVGYNYKLTHPNRSFVINRLREQPALTTGVPYLYCDYRE
ncbi:hypothetical protein GX48_06201 [Paracoccidioides brasiliensis]|nr:hypothetical protein GX48_06201 [Paracoccidioides brasiliensis]